MSRLSSLHRPLTRRLGESEPAVSRGVSGISDALEPDSGDFLGKNERGGFCGPEVDERSQRVAEIRHFQQSSHQWDSSTSGTWQDTGSVLVIDDAEQTLQDETTWIPSMRPSMATTIEESSEEPMELWQSESLRDSLRCANPKAYVGSKESILIQQDCDALAESRSEGSYHTPHSTLLPDVVARSHTSSASPARINNGM